MTPAAHTVAAVSTLLSADPGVSTELRTLIVTAPESGGQVNLRDASRILKVHRGTLWRMRQDGRVNLRRVGVVGRDCMVNVSDVLEQLNKRSKS